MTINGKNISIGTIATLIPIAMFYFYIAEKGILPISEAAHAQDMARVECSIAHLDWAQANDNLRYAKTDLVASPNDITYQRAVENYSALLNDAQRRIDLYCY